MNDALTLHRMLLQDGIRHEIVQLRWTIASADQLPGVLALPAERCLAVRVYRVDGEYAAVIVRAGDVPPLPLVCAVTGGRSVYPASGDVVSLVTGYPAGLVAPLALPGDLRVYADQALPGGLGGGAGAVYTATGEAGTALGIGLPDVLALCTAKPVALRSALCKGDAVKITGWLLRSRLAARAGAPAPLSRLGCD
jgi:prolyl-tRNA editing enzyme YbaK/EbsC (Cys-tRNA(Pro) deacylase)